MTLWSVMSPLDMFLAHLIDFNQDVLLLSKVRDFGSGCMRADAREVSLVKRGHMARERMQERMRERILSHVMSLSQSNLLN